MKEKKSSGFVGAVSENLKKRAERAGFDPEKEHPGRMLWHVVGGFRGLVEAVVPGVAYIVAYTVSGVLWLSLVISLLVAAGLLVARLAARSSIGPAAAGFFTAGVSALISLYTGRGVDNFLAGLMANTFYGLVFLVSILIGWPLAGLLIGLIMGERFSWRKDKRKRAYFSLITLVFAVMFALRLVVQLPLYFAEKVVALGTVKIIMGVPLTVLGLIVSWFLFRRVYPPSKKKVETD